MRISDWSSDVCSSDLAFAVERPVAIGTQVVAGEVAGDLAQPRQEAGRVLQALEVLPGGEEGILEIGRASCRERVCQYVSISVVAVSLKKKNKANRAINTYKS